VSLHTGITNSNVHFGAKVFMYGKTPSLLGTKVVKALEDFAAPIKRTHKFFISLTDVGINGDVYIDCVRDGCMIATYVPIQSAKISPTPEQLLEIITTEMRLMVEHSQGIDGIIPTREHLVNTKVNGLHTAEPTLWSNLA